MSATAPKRPGGRSTRVRAAVFAAAEALLQENDGALPSMPAIAQRAGVNATSLYRRWGDVRTLYVDMAVEKLSREQPLPDTGSVRGDLTAWTIAVARAVGGRDWLSLQRILMLAPAKGKEAGATAAPDIMATPIARRIEELEGLLARGRQRGEKVPHVGQIIEIVLAPLYLHGLFLGEIAAPERTARLVDRLMLLAEHEVWGE